MKFEIYHYPDLSYCLVPTETPKESKDFLTLDGSLIDEFSVDTHQEATDYYNTFIVKYQKELNEQKCSKKT